MKHFFKKYWASILIISIIILGFELRIFSFHWPYLRNIDSYFFWRHMDYIVEHGSLPEIDKLMLSPTGLEIGKRVLYQYIGAYSYLFVSYFFNIELWEYLIYFPAFLASLMAIPMYYIGKLLWDKKAGILSAFFVVFNISNFARSLGGDPDTDAIVMLMPLIVVAVFLFVYKDMEKRTTIKNIICFALFGVINAVFAFIWTGYWYIFLILYGFLLAKIIIKVVCRANPKKIAQMFVVSLISFWIITVPIMGTIMFYDPLHQLFYNAGITGPGLKGEKGIRFPNVYVSVQELQVGGGLREIAERTSGFSFTNPLMILVSPFMLTIFTTIYLLYLFWKRREHFDTLLLLFFWFFGPLMAAMVAVRFAILLTPVFSLGSGMFLSMVIDHAYKIGVKHENRT